MYLNVSNCIHSIFECIFSVVVYFNVFQCVEKDLNVYIDIVIGISPSYSHCNVFAMCTHIHVCFSLSTMTTVREGRFRQLSAKIEFPH
jgi:hypothetical protein